MNGACFSTLRLHFAPRNTMIQERHAEKNYGFYLVLELIVPELTSLSKFRVDKNETPFRRSMSRSNMIICNYVTGC